MDMSMDCIDILKSIRAEVGPALTEGLSPAEISCLLDTHMSLHTAIRDAWATWQTMSPEDKQFLKKSEGEAICALQEGVLNFYAPDAVNPYLPLAAQGPWIITAYGSVLYEVGGYGMLGWGHNPEMVCEALKNRQVMANIMTPNFKQKKVVDLLKQKIGFRKGKCPFSHFVWMNSGSEGVTVSYRIVDVHSKIMTDPDGRHAGKKIMLASAKGGFHGRTDSAAQISDSSMKNYKKYLASYRDRDQLLLFENNNIESAKEVFARAERENIFIEAVYIEPVMGEGNPGLGITPEFYSTLRELTKSHGSLLIADSIQAGMRAHGCLSIVDYPGFQEALAPDMEVYSKALNAGQYPISVLAMTEEVAKLYRTGLYGNTMTTNPRALDVAAAVLGALTPELAENISRRGREFIVKFRKLQEEFPAIITQVQGTGLLFGVELEKKLFPVVGRGGVEEYLRFKGLNVIHGGPNALRFTPHFGITSAEVDLVVGLVREGLVHFAEKAAKAASSSVSPSTPTPQ
jgi:acetylornithine/succinyldiaminopimelate/putrescine aminotransferase